MWTQMLLRFFLLLLLFAAELMMSFTVLFVLNCVDTAQVFLKMWPLAKVEVSQPHTTCK